MKAGFWGLRRARRGAGAGAVVFGAPGPFFKAVLEASRYVELYDEELAGEPCRRGVSTAAVPAGGLTRRLAMAPETFVCLVGYPSLAPGLLGRAGARVIFAPAPGAPEGPVLKKGDLVVGLRGLGPGKGAAGPRLMTAREVLLPRPGDRRRWPAESVVVLDPLVMDPSQMPLRDNLEPGGLTWYALTDLLRECFSRSRVRAVQLLPRPLPRRDTYPSFVLARLVSRILALALLPSRGE